MNQSIDKEHLIKEIQAIIKIRPNFLSHITDNLENQSTTRLRDLLYLFNFYIDYDSFGKGMVDIMTLVDICKEYTNKKYTFDKRYLYSYYILIIELFQYPEYVKLLNSFDPYEIHDKLMKHIKIGEPCILEDFVLNLDTYIKNHDYNCANSKLIDNYVDWRNSNQKQGAFLTNYLVDISCTTSNKEEVGYLLKNKVNPEIYSTLLLRTSILTRRKIYDSETLSQTLPLPQLLEWVTYFKPNLVEILIPKLASGELNLNAFSYKALRETYDNFLSKISSFSIDTFDRLKSNNYIDFHDLSDVLSLLTLIKNREGTDYLEVIDPDNLEHLTPGYYNCKLTAIETILICSELARELGFEHKYIINTWLRAIYNDNYTWQYMKLLKAELMQLLRGRDLTIYLDLNLSANEILEMKSMENDLPTGFKFKSVSYYFVQSKGEKLHESIN